MLKIKLLVIILVVSILGVVYLRNDIQKENGNTITVVASFYPLYEFAVNVGGEKVNVVNMTPSGMEPHDFDPTPRDIVTLRESDIFIYNGAGLEAWVERIIPDLEDSNTIIVKSSEGVSLFSSNEGTTFDPHIWLDPKLASIQVDNIYKGLAKADPENKEFYEMNTKIYKEKLSELDDNYASVLSNCKSKDVVVSHNAYGYLARRYGLNLIPISGLSPEEEPSLMELAKIVDTVKNNNIKFIFFETLVSPRFSETIADEVGVQTLVLNPIEGLTNEETTAGENYISVSYKNLDNLKKALECN